MNRLFAAAGIALTLSAIGWLNFHWVETPLHLSPGISEKPAPRTGLDSVSEGAAGPRLELPAEMTETLLRPLFHASRRPFKPALAPVAAAVADEEPPAPVVDPEAPEVRPELRLAGISLSGSRKRALLGPASGSEVSWYSQGDNIGGWVVASITNQTVTFASGEQTFAMPLYPASAWDGSGP